MVHKKHAIEAGLESSLFYEVVQTGNPSTPTSTAPTVP
jgi:hypothetical protein